MVLGCMHAVLLATAHTRLDVNGRAALRHGTAKAQGHTATASRNWQHAAPPHQPAAAAPATPLDASEAAESSPAPLPFEIYESATRGELQKVVSWLRKGGAVDAVCSATTKDGRPSTYTLLHAAAANDQLEMVSELLKRGASVDLPASLGATALMMAASYGHLSIVLVLLQHSADPDLQNIDGNTALMWAAYER